MSLLRQVYLKSYMAVFLGKNHVCCNNIMILIIYYYLVFFRENIQSFVHEPLTTITSIKANFLGCYNYSYLFNRFKSPTTLSLFPTTIKSLVTYNNVLPL